MTKYGQRSRARCPFCHKVMAVHVPRGGDGSAEVFPHHPRGSENPCRGSYAHLVTQEDYDAANDLMSALERSLTPERTIDLDRPCPHGDFVATVEVQRLSSVESGPIDGYMADIRVRCADCDEEFRWQGVEAGLNFTRPTCSVDEGELHAPLRPASADPDFGMGIPGFAVRFQEGREGDER